MLSLKYVDYVVIFDEDTPYNLIKKINPDILVKGGDYDIKDIVGSDLVKKTKALNYIKDKSTSLIVSKIKAKDAAIITLKPTTTPKINKLR